MIAGLITDSLYTDELVYPVNESFGLLMGYGYGYC